MTIVIGIATPEGVYIGSDSASSNSYITYETSAPKVFTKENLLFGVSGTWRFAQVLRHETSIPKQTYGQSDEQYLFVDVIGALRKSLKKAGVVIVRSGLESTDGSYALVGYKDKLYGLESDFSLHPKEPFGAIGAGVMYALGSLHTTEKLSLTSRKRITIGLQAACKFSPTCGGKLIIKFKKK